MGWEWGRNKGADAGKERRHRLENMDMPVSERICVSRNERETERHGDRDGSSKGVEHLRKNRSGKEILRKLYCLTCISFLYSTNIGHVCFQSWI